NKEKFAAYNLTVICGEAPTALKKIPCPNCAFIGGSHGNIVEILHELIFKNENIRIVLTAVTMETLCTAWEAFKTLNIKNVEIVEVSVTNATKVGNYNLLKSENPVFILSGGGKSDD
ncbi:MAG: bifunctional cobalt-precorrin-7 (C(5))-methyltransferase/cobalt-precorrin-6B (C(15))-methyltransferase, partial [Oscillospiraceae bacterium]